MPRLEGQRSHIGLYVLLALVLLLLVVVALEILGVTNLIANFGAA